MLRTPLCDMLGIDVPILQGALGPHDTAGLAAAVSSAGGLGMISSIHEPRAYQRTQAQLEVMHAKGRSFGMNIPVKSVEGETRLRAALDLLAAMPDLKQTLKVVVTAAGSPFKYSRQIRDASFHHFHLVASPDQARKAADAGCTGLIVEGNESGGHVLSAEGPTSMTLIPTVAEDVGLPVIAAGGFVDGKGLVAALALGAVGIQMGTRFYMTQEAASFAPPAIQTALLSAGLTDTTIISSVYGPNRHWKNAFVDQLRRAGPQDGFTAEVQALKEGAAAAYAANDADRATVPIGMCVGRIREVETVAAVIGRIMSQADATLASLSELRSTG